MLLLGILKMIGSIIEFVELQRLCRPHGPRPSVTTVIRWAKQQGIRYKLDGCGGIWTTSEALNAALGLTNISLVNSSDIEELI